MGNFGLFYLQKIQKLLMIFEITKWLIMQAS